MSYLVTCSLATDADTILPDPKHPSYKVLIRINPENVIGRESGTYASGLTFKKRESYRWYLEILDGFGCLLNIERAVVGADTRGFERIRQTFDFVVPRSNTVISLRVD
jgi:hypothetical protein